MNHSKYNFKTNNENISVFGSNNSTSYNTYGSKDIFPKINAVNNQLIRNSVLQAYHTNKYFNIIDNNCNSLPSNNKSKEYTFKPAQKEEGKLSKISSNNNNNKFRLSCHRH